VKIAKGRWFKWSHAQHARMLHAVWDGHILHSINVLVNVCNEQMCLACAVAIVLCTPFALKVRTWWNHNTSQYDQQHLYTELIKYRMNCGFHYGRLPRTSVRFGIEVLNDLELWLSRYHCCFSIKLQVSWQQPTVWHHPLRACLPHQSRSHVSAMNHCIHRYPLFTDTATHCMKLLFHLIFAVNIDCVEAAVACVWTPYHYPIGYTTCDIDIVYPSMVFLYAGLPPLRIR